MSSRASNDELTDLPDLEHKVLARIGKSFAGGCGSITDSFIEPGLADADIAQVNSATEAAIRALVEKGLVDLPHGSVALERDTPIRLTSKGADCLEIRIATGREIAGVIGMLLAVRRVVLALMEELATDGNRNGDQFRSQVIAGLRDEISRERESARSAGALSHAKREWLSSFITDIESLRADPRG